jgi:hypothetical protein
MIALVASLLDTGGRVVLGAILAIGWGLASQWPSVSPVEAGPARAVDPNAHDRCAGACLDVSSSPNGIRTRAATLREGPALGRQQTT